MNSFLVLIACVGFVAAEPLYGVSASQYRYQDEVGQHAFGHVGGPNSREEVKSADGVTRGSYSYVDGHGLVQSAVYTADGAGFRVAATNLPVGPAVPASEAAVVAAAPVVAAPALAAAPVVAAAPSFAATPAVVAARAYAAPVPAFYSAQYAVPSVYHPHGAVVHSLKKRDLVAVHQPLTSYPGSTAPLVHAPVVAPLYATHTPYVAHPFAHYLKKRSAAYAPLAYAHGVYPGSLSVPLDTPEVAHAKAANLAQQHTEAVRNTYGGVPLSLPADTPEVAAAKIAHAVATSPKAFVAPAVYSPYVNTPYVNTPYVHTPYVHAVHALKKRSVVYAPTLAYAHGVHPGSLSVPLDEPVVAHAKAANLVQQHTEAVRNTYGGVPLALPADTPEVAAGKVAHAVAHANQAAAVSYPSYYYL